MAVRLPAVLVFAYGTPAAAIFCYGVYCNDSFYGHGDLRFVRAVRWLVVSVPGHGTVCSCTSLYG